MIDNRMNLIFYYGHISVPIFFILLILFMRYRRKRKGLDVDLTMPWKPLLVIQVVLTCTLLAILLSIGLLLAVGSAILGLIASVSDLTLFEKYTEYVWGMLLSDLFTVILNYGSILMCTIGYNKIRISNNKEPLKTLYYIFAIFFLVLPLLLFIPPLFSYLLYKLQYI